MLVGPPTLLHLARVGAPEKIGHEVLAIGSTHAVISRNDWAGLWDRKKQVVVRALPGVRFAAFAPDGSALAVTTFDGEVLILSPDGTSIRERYATSDAHSEIVWRDRLALEELNFYRVLR